MVVGKIVKQLPRIKLYLLNKMAIWYGSTIISAKIASDANSYIPFNMLIWMLHIVSLLRRLSREAVTRCAKKNVARQQITKCRKHFLIGKSANIITFGFYFGVVIRTPSCWWLCACNILSMFLSLSIFFYCSNSFSLTWYFVSLRRKSN